MWATIEFQVFNVALGFSDGHGHMPIDGPIHTILEEEQHPDA